MGTRIGIGVRLQRRRIAAFAAPVMPVEPPPVEPPPVEPPPVEPPPVEPPPVDPPPVVPPPVVPPGQPGQPALTARATDSITVAWAAPATGGAATSYRVRYSTDNNITAADPSKTVAETNATITGLAPGTDYWIDVIAVNDDGDSVDSADLATATNAAAPPPEPMSNYERIAALPGAYAVRFNASPRQVDLFEVSPTEGAELEHTPAGMYTDPAVYWIERVRGMRNGIGGRDDIGAVYRQFFMVMHRGGSSVQQIDFLPPLSDEHSWVVINEATEEWIMWPANASQALGGGYVNYRVIPSYIVDTNDSNSAVVNAIAEHFSGGEDATAAANFQNALSGRELVVALIPNNSFRPSFPAN